MRHELKNYEKIHMIVVFFGNPLFRNLAFHKDKTVNKIPKAKAVA